MARFITLYSGSSGNAGVVEEDGRYLLVDVGASRKATVESLLSLGLSSDGLGGILVTHEHVDHIRGLKVFLKKTPVPVYASAATLRMLWNMEAVPEGAELIALDGRTEEVNGFAVNGFSTSHDAAGCCGFRIAAPSGAVMAIATDLGTITDEVYGALQGVGLLALEANYDPEMLRTGRYPAQLKRRIASAHGHLSNETCAAVVADAVGKGCKRVVLCHLSEENNTPALVRSAVERAFLLAGHTALEDCEVQIARRYAVGDWMEF